MTPEEGQVELCHGRYEEFRVLAGPMRMHRTKVNGDGIEGEPAEVCLENGC